MCKISYNGSLYQQNSLKIIKTLLWATFWHARYISGNLLNTMTSATKNNLYGNGIVPVWTEGNSRTWDNRTNSKLHVDPGIHSADVLVCPEPIQLESHEDVNTKPSIWKHVESHSGSLCAADRSRPASFHLMFQVVG